jgi:hypothetical protein
MSPSNPPSVMVSWKTAFTCLYPLKLISNSWHFNLC